MLVGRSIQRSSASYKLYKNSEKLKTHQKSRFLNKIAVSSALKVTHTHIVIKYCRRYPH